MKLYSRERNGGLRAAIFIGAYLMKSKSRGEKIPNCKERGEWAELRFMARAAEEGFRVSKPWGDSARYDFAVEENGRFLRIQVKSTACRSGDGYQCSIQPPPGVSKRYTAEQVDFFAAFVIPEDVWYILPAQAALHLASRIQLSPDCKNQRYACYKEAWHLLHEAIARKAGDAAPVASPLPAPVVEDDDPEAQPAEISQMRGAVESAGSPGFDPDLLRSRMAGCFERMLKRR
jgi:hypothetical protein